MENSTPYTDPERFFDYRCDHCGQPFCERVHVMNMTLDHIEEEACLSCLANEYNKTEAEMAKFCWDYVQARECFKTPWMHFNAKTCPHQANATCHCQLEAT